MRNTGVKTLGPADTITSAHVDILMIDILYNNKGKQSTHGEKSDQARKTFGLRTRTDATTFPFRIDNFNLKFQIGIGWYHLPSPSTLCTIGQRRGDHKFPITTNLHGWDVEGGITTNPDFPSRNRLAPM